MRRGKGRSTKVSKGDTRFKRTKRKNKKIKRKKAGAPTACSRLKENDCKSNSRCTWNEFDIRDFDMNTSKGKQKLFDLKESLMKRYTKGELRKYLGSEDPTFFQVYIRAKKEYDNGLRGLCGNKMFQGFELSDILKKRVKKDYPELRKSKNKTKTLKKDKDLAEDLLKKAMKKSKPDKEIQAIIEKFGLVEKDLQQIYDKNNKQFSKLDKFLSPDHDEVSSLLGMVEDEVNLERNEDTDIQRRLDRLKKAGTYKKKKKTKKNKRTKKNRRTKRNTRKTSKRQRGGMEAGGGMTKEDMSTLSHIKDIAEVEGLTREEYLKAISQLYGIIKQYSTLSEEMGLKTIFGKLENKIKSIDEADAEAAPAADAPAAPPPAATHSLDTSVEVAVPSAGGTGDTGHLSGEDPELEEEPRRLARGSVGVDPREESEGRVSEAGGVAATPTLSVYNINSGTYIEIPVYMTEVEANDLGFRDPTFSTKKGFFGGEKYNKGEREELNKGKTICVKVNSGEDVWRVATVESFNETKKKGASSHTVIFGDKTEPEEVYLSKNSEDTDTRKKQWLIYRPDIALAKDLQQKSERATLQANIRENSRNEQTFSQQAKQHLSRGEINEAIINFKNAISLLIRLIIDNPLNKEEYHRKIEEYKGRLGFLNELREISSGEQRRQLTETQRDLQQLSIILQRDKEIDDNMALAQLAESLSQPKSNEAFQRLRAREFSQKLPDAPE